MEPDHPVTCLELTVDDPALVVAGELARAQAEHPHEVVVGGLEIGIDQDRDPALDGRVEHRHLLENFQQIVGQGTLGIARGRHEPVEAPPQPPAGLEPSLQLPEMGRHGGPEAPGRVVQGPADLAEGQAEAPEQADPVQALHVGVGVEAVAGIGAVRGHQ